MMFLLCVSSLLLSELHLFRSTHLQPTSRRRCTSDSSTSDDGKPHLPSDGSKAKGRHGVEDLVPNPGAAGCGVLSAFVVVAVGM